MCLPPDSRAARLYTIRRSSFVEPFVAPSGTDWWVKAALVAASMLSSGSWSADFPQRPIRWIVPFPPGGSVDLVGRVIAQKLYTVWGQQLVIDNRPAAGGRLGTQIAAQAAPDGYTQLLTLNPNLTADRSLFKSLPYDPEKAFLPITITAGTSQL